VLDGAYAHPLAYWAVARDEGPRNPAVAATRGHDRLHPECAEIETGETVRSCCSPRAEDLPADEEYALFLRFTGLSRAPRAAALEAEPLGDIDLTTGRASSSAAGRSTRPIRPSEVGRAARRGRDLDSSRCRGRARLPLLRRVLRHRHRRGARGRCHRRHPSRADQRRRGCAHRRRRRRSAPGEPPDTFAAFVGHKEAITILQPSATLLVRGEACPVQMFRVGRNVYATQFHPECDVEGISTRIRAYADYGYFAPGELDLTLAAVRRVPVTHTGEILAAFVRRYAR
jgi:GMP synthase (glutamine-hydrolysing)